MTECRYYEMCALRASIRSLPRSCDARHCWMFRPMPDVDALLGLAAEIERDVAIVDHYNLRMKTASVGRYAERIREALGVVA